MHSCSFAQAEDEECVGGGRGTLPNDTALGHSVRSHCFYSIWGVELTSGLELLNERKALNCHHSPDLVFSRYIGTITPRIAGKNPGASGGGGLVMQGVLWGRTNGGSCKYWRWKIKATGPKKEKKKINTLCKFHFFKNWLAYIILSVYFIHTYIHTYIYIYYIRRQWKRQGNWGDCMSCKLLYWFVVNTAWVCTKGLINMGSTPKGFCSPLLMSYSWCWDQFPFMVSSGGH